MNPQTRINGFKKPFTPRPAKVIPAINGRVQAKPERLPPNSQEAERGIIGSILWEPEQSLNLIAARIISTDEFYDLRHRAIYETAAAMQANRETVDMVTLHQKLRDNGMLEGIGGIEYLNRAQDETPSAANLSAYIDEVQEKHLLRRMIKVCSEAVAKVYEFNGEAYELLDEVERNVLALRQRKHREASIKQHVQDAVSMMEDKFNRKGAITGLSTGFPDLDYYTDGLCQAELIVPAAFPGVGKTSLTMNWVENAVLANDFAVAVFSQEMTCRQLTARMLCSTARVNLKNIGRGEMVEADFGKLIAAAGKLSKSKLHLIEGAESITQIVAAARRLKQQHDIRLIVVDYLQLVTGGGGGDQSREQEVSGVAMALKRLAKELDIPVVAPSQMNDDGKLRESRAIGQHADLIMKMKSVAKEDENCEHGEPVDVFIEKNRNGPSHVTVHLTFLKEFTRFESAAKVSDEDMPGNTEEPAQRYPED